MLGESMLLILLLIFAYIEANALQISSEEVKRVGDFIYKRECASNQSKLIFWNEQEEFPSLGIGHFIWHTKTGAKDKIQQFPELIAYFKKNNLIIHGWLSCPFAPWKDRKEFLAEQGSDRMKELLELLSNTIQLQAQFIVERFQKTSLENILKVLTQENQKKIKRQLDRLIAVPGGYVALIDYTNFKGDGTNLAERYCNQGWGLLQVLLNMTETNSPLQDFVASAQDLLAQRVANSAPEKNEQKWLLGWNNRVKSYLAIK